MTRLKVYEGQEKIQEIELSSGIVHIGREPSNTLVLQDASVSRRHAQVEPHGHLYLIRDNGSTNGTFVNEMLVRVQVLGVGDTVRIGKYILQIDEGKPRGRESTRIRVEKLSLQGTAAGASQSQPPPGSGGPILKTGTTSAAIATRRLSKLNRIQSEIGHIDTPDALFQRTVALVLPELEAQKAVILEVVAPEGSARQRKTLEFKPAAIESHTPRGDRKEDLVIQDELLQKAASDEEGYHTVLPATGEAGSRGEGGREIIAVPIREGKALRGLLYVERPQGTTFYTTEDREFLLAIVQVLAASLANAKLFEEATASRKKMQAILSSLTDGILVADKSFMILEANMAASVMVKPGTRNPLGLSFFELIEGFQLSPAAEVLKASALKEGAVFHLTRPGAQESSAEIVHLSGSALPYPAGSSQPEGLVITLRDRSDLFRIESQKVQFLENFAHKLRTPLTVLESNLAIVQSHPQEMAEIVEDLKRNSRTLCTVVDQLTEFADLELRSSRLTVLPEPTRLDEVAAAALRNMSSRAGEKEVAIRCTVSTQLPPAIVRPAQIQRAIELVLENAIKFTPSHGSVVIQGEEQPGYVRIDIVDDGPGIPQDELESVFYLGHQVDLEQTGQVPGAGLGLTLARHILQVQGGEVRITSPFGSNDHGTQVSLFLPTRAPASERAPLAAELAIQHASGEILSVQ